MMYEDRQCCHKFCKKIQIQISYSVNFKYVSGFVRVALHQGSWTLPVCTDLSFAIQQNNWYEELQTNKSVNPVLVLNDACI